MKCQESGMLAHYINRGKRKENVKKELEKGQQEMIKQISAAWSDSTNQIFENKPDSSEKPENNNQQQPPSFGFVSQCAVAKIQRIVDFCRKLPEWDSIDQAIQIKLIKGGISEAMILFNTLTFDPITEEVIWMDGKRRSKDAFISSGFKPDTVKEIFDIWKFCSKTNLAEPTTLSLIVASVITSPDRHIFQG